MTRIILTLITFSINFICGFSQTNQTMFLGHSLVNFNIPNMVNKLSIAGSNNFTYKAHIGNGANLMWQYTNPYSAQGNIWDTTLSNGGFEHFIVTEAIALKSHLQWSNTYRYADSFYRFAMQYNPNVQYYLYETWHCINSGTPTGCPWDNESNIPWRNRLTLDLPYWESIADSINLIHPKPMLVIPGGQAMARLYDSIVAGVVPGITSINQLFSDDIHLTNIGNYFIACVMYGVIHKASPLGLPNQLTDPWGAPYTTYPTQAQAAKLQQIAWTTLCDYPRDGVICSPTLLTELQQPKSIFYPNPINDVLHIELLHGVGEVALYDVQMSVVMKKDFGNKTHVTWNLSELQQGLYFIRIANGNLQKLIIQ